MAFPQVDLRGDEALQAGAHHPPDLSRPGLLSDLQPEDVQQSLAQPASTQAGCITLKSTALTRRREPTARIPLFLHL